jgi:hypothetical protein
MEIMQIDEHVAHMNLTSVTQDIQGEDREVATPLPVGEPPAGMSHRAHARTLVLGAQLPPMPTTAAGRK